MEYMLVESLFGLWIFLNGKSLFCIGFSLSTMPDSAIKLPDQKSSRYKVLPVQIYCLIVFFLSRLGPN